MTQINTFKEYIEFTKTTAVYPKEQALSYLVFGLVDEIFELKLKVEHTFTVNEVIDEMSDVCWYVAQLCDLLNIDINETERSSNNYINIHFSNNIANTQEVTVYLEDIIRRSGKICGLIKKYIRDDNQEKIEKVKHQLLFIINRLQHLAPSIGGYNLKNVLQINVNKLSDRKERGVLKGDGDNR